MNISVLIAGVGGQGTLLAARIIGGAAMQAGFNVKISEVHGMSQRGGSVITYVRFGETPISSPLIDFGGADIIMAFEELEALRALSYLKPGGIILASTERINPMPVIMGATSYPNGIIEEIKARGIHVADIDAKKLASDAGNEKAANVVLIGLLAARLDLQNDIWIDKINSFVPKKFVGVNLRAFDAGYEKGRAFFGK